MSSRCRFLLVCVAAACFWHGYFLDLFPLSEARDWLGWGGNEGIRSQVLNDLLYRQTRFSRDLSMLVTFGVGSVCSNSVLCVNAGLALPLVLASLALYVWMCGISVPRGVAACLTIVWALSFPYLVTSSWQATIHDRLGLLATFTAFALVWRFSPTWSVGHLTWYAAAQLLLTVAAMNSKEAYWFLLPALCLAHASRFLALPDAPSWRPIVLTLVPACLYAAWFALCYLRAAPFSPEWATHVGTGALAHNAVSYTKAIFGTVAVAAMVGAVVAVVVRQNWRSWTSDHRRKLSWTVIVMVAAYVPIAKTRYPAEYYVLAPMAVLLVAIGLCFRDSSGNRAQPTLLRYVAIGGLGLGTLISIRSDRAEFYLHRATLSDNFQRAVYSRRDLAGAAAAAGVLCVSVDENSPQSYLFTDSKFAWDILRWNSDEGVAVQLRDVPVAVRTPASGPNCVPSLLLDSNLRAR